MGGTGKAARVAQDILTVLNREADSNRQCRGSGVILAIARQTGLSESHVRAYITAVESLGVVKVTRTRESRAMGNSRLRVEMIITILMPDAVFGVKRGYLCIAKE